ncbi:MULTISPECIES: MerR family transcriptional regulator [Gordonia]|uniref:HTH merR-type domain-containing protein n=2 Tax=Gordonia TaxID=2053 RepID=A0ABN3HVU7_9ACTN|nr:MULTISPECIES: MerR family transcriptional regulator [Gordonia]AUH68448.1 MerR family DNA-binding transcriptional regulator [Gordonia sp. YC-JH1]KXT57567.1 MerR family transcriptional regulator [Gordonia sp. QH-12]WFN91756.1 MerR family transcriptional regulator [Gordonia sihwensis]GAC60567.1 putative MerR family transcriptional regulator [Gordonia sihwensis NBRC 108236]
MTEYRIDDLARISGVTTRNIRGYQEHGLLPRPVRRGRVAIYTEKHLSRLRAIDKLLRNGFTLKHIATFLTNPRALVGEALELTEILDEPWASTERTVFDRPALERLFGTVDDADVQALLGAGLLEETADGAAYETGDPRSLRNLARLVEQGMRLTVLADVHRRFAEKVAEAAEILMVSAREEVDRRRGPGWVPADQDEASWAASLLGTMRAVGTQNAHATLDRCLDGALDHELRVHQHAAGERESQSSSH